MVSRQTILRHFPGFGFGLGCLLALILMSLPIASAQYPPTFQLFKNGAAVMMEDYASLPLSSLREKDGPYPPPVNKQGQLARANKMTSEPPDAPQSASRHFFPDQNGNLYILDKASRKFTPYIDFGKVYPKFNTVPYYGMGVLAIVFDPAYARNGKFYTIHTENPNMPGSAAPSNASLPDLDLKGFSTTVAINPPGPEVARYDSIITEWKDTDIKNSTFEGTAREVLRIGSYFGRHPGMADMLFNPLARPGDADYGNLYIGVGDGTSGETPGDINTVPQRLDSLLGKVLRITPDVSLRPNDMMSSNGRYRIPSTGPDPNPFVAIKSARPEIFTYGHRNPHRLSWDRVTNTFFINEVGNHSWEEMNIAVKGANYGWPAREGPEQHFFVGGPNGGQTGSQVNPSAPFPSPDTLSVAGLEKPVTPVYPVATFSHRDGNAVGSGFVYRGKLMPQLVGKYIFTDIPSGRLFYADLEEMKVARGLRSKQAAIHELQIVYKSPYGNSTEGAVKRRMFDIVADAFREKGGVATAPCIIPDGNSPQGELVKCGARGQGPDPYGVAYGGGRADVRMDMDSDGEIYVLSKADGMIRKLVSVVTPPPSSR
ncbi:MAG: PQQ-dependent sugar dehydrogenase [Acidobacteria bacterium]|nr:PQQ-dependent sugar dehydrogenase [Acidobacteriota bacterium]